MRSLRRQPVVLVGVLTLLVGVLRPSAAAPPATLRLSEAFGPPTSSVKVLGKGFGANEVVDLTFDTTPVGQATSNGAGRFSTTIIVPDLALPGSHTVTATGETSGLTASAPFTVRTDWTKFHFDAPNSGFNLYENVLSPANVGNLTLKWSTHTVAYVSSSPAVAGGVVYVGIGPHGLDYANLLALDAQTGAELWNVRTNGGFPSDPTVARRVVYLGTESDHKLHAYNARTGSVLWAFQAVGAVGDPAVVGNTVYVPVNTGIIYAVDATTGNELWEAQTGGASFARSAAVSNGLVYIGSDDNKLYAFDSSTGGLAWTALTGGDVDSSPAVANGVVYVGSLDYNLYAFDAETGNFLWKAPTGGNVDSSPAVANGVVYVQSGDASVYAFDAMTGAKLWAFPSGSDLILQLVVANGVVYFGSGDHNVYALDAATGAELWRYTTGDQIVDAPAVADGVLYVGSFDHNLYAFGLP